MGPAVRFRTCGSAIVLALVMAPQDARATEIEATAAGGITGYASTWHGDYGIGGTLRLGARIGRVVQPDIQVWESFASINERANTQLSLGVSAFVPLPAVHPFARFYVFHQHEEGLVSVENTPGGFLFGIGPGIRHRAGGGLMFGLELPMRVFRSDRLTTPFFAEVKADYFPDNTLGPTAYVGLDVGIGLNYLLQ
jgi:hypothetical protein